MPNSWATGAVAIAQRTLGAVLPALLGAQAMRAALDSEQGRVDLELNAALAYAGGFPEPLRGRPGDIRDTVRVNLIRPVVHATVAFLFGEPPGWDLAGDGDADPAQATPAEAWMVDTLRAMHWPARLLALGINGAIFGTAYWRVREPDAEHPRPYLQELPPECMTVQTDPRDIDRVVGYTYQRDDVPDAQSGTPQLWRQRWTRAAAGAGWTMVEETAAFDGAAWRPAGPPLPWPKPWAPILHCQNLPAPNAVYGLPDVTPTLIEANLAINLSATAAARIQRHHASPHIWVSGMPNSQINMSIGGIIYLDNPEAKIGQLVPAVNGTESQAFRAELHEAICEESATPSIVLGRADGATRADPSGVALKTKLWPLLVKTQMKQQTYGPLLSEALRRLWELGGYGPNCRAVWTWKEHLPTDPLEEAQTLQLHEQLGVSEETILEKLGYNPGVERAQRAAEAADGLTEMQGRITQLRAAQVLAGADAPGADAPDAGPQ